jgi:hypothetical protein
MHAERACHESDARDDEECERQGEYEQPVRESAGKYAAADVGVSLDRLEVASSVAERARASSIDPFSACTCST